MSQFALPAAGRPIPDESVSLAVLTVATEDFTSPLKDYLSLWAKRFELSKEDEKALERFENNFIEIQRKIAETVLSDFHRILVPGGVACYVEPVGVEGRGEKAGRKNFFSEEGITALIPPTLPFKVERRNSWLRPVHHDVSGEPDRYYVIEAITLKKEG